MKVFSSFSICNVRKHVADRIYRKDGYLTVS